MRGHPLHREITETDPGGRRPPNGRSRSPEAESTDSAAPVIATASHPERLRAAAGEPDRAAEALSALLIGGRNPAATARAAGITIAEEYTVVALAITISRPPDHADLDGVARLQRTVIRTCGPGTLPLIGVGGGTVLVPADEAEDDVPSGLMEHLRRTARAPVTAVAVPSLIDSIPRTTHLAHELLDIACRLHYRPRLYRFEDLTLEYQLTRPGAATEYLSRIVDPITDHPELMRTLRQHIGNNFHRQQTARALNIHSNTVDYRLRRVKELTGLDPSRLADLWHLQSALVVHAYRNAHP